MKAYIARNILGEAPEGQIVYVLVIVDYGREIEELTTFETSELLFNYLTNYVRDTWQEVFDFPVDDIPDDEIIDALFNPTTQYSYTITKALHYKEK